MTLESTVNKNRYIGNGSTKTFAFTFKVWKTDEVKVLVGDGTTDRDASSEVGVNITPSGGSVVFGTAPGQGQVVIIRRNMPYIQEDDYRNGTRFDSEEVEDRFDQDCAERQDLRLDVGRAVKVPETSNKTPEEWWQDFVHAVGDVQEAKGLIWAWLQTIGSDVVGTATPVIASGTSALRTLGDRFADIVNLKDYGAKGNGIANDTAAADAWLAADGGVKYIPAGDYLVRGTVRHYPEGRFWDGVTTDFDNLYIHPALTLYGGNDVGTDYPGLVSGDSNAWDGATQGPFVDPFDKVLYITRENSDHQVRLSALRWSENPSERIALGHSPFGYNAGHQSNALYRPSALAEPLFFFPRNYHVSAGQTAYPYTVRVTKWDYRSPSTFTVVREFTLFDSETHQTDSLLRFGISFDSKYFFAEAVRRSDSKRIIRFWDARKMLQQASNNIASLYEFESFRPEGTAAGGQAVVSDGKYLYQLSGDQVTYISCTTLNGDFCFHRPKKKFISERYSVASSAEAEGLFWAPWNGKIEMFYMTSDRVFDQGDDTNYTRRDSFWGMSIPAAEQSDGVHAAYKEPPVNSSETPDLNKATDPGWYYTADSYANMPSANSGYLFVARHIFDSYNCVQMHFARGSVQNTYLRHITGEGVAGDWEKVTFSTDSHTPRFGSVYLKHPDTVKGTRPDSDKTSLVVFCDSLGAETQNRLGTIRFFTGSASTANDKIQLQIYDFVSASTESSSIEMMRDSNGVFFRPVERDDVAFSLGSGSRYWDNAYVTTGHIGESDRRVKDNIEEPSEALLRAWGKIHTVGFQFKSAVKKKGSNARIHIGYIAQDIDDAFASEGLNAGDYGLFCYDEWNDEYENRKVVDSEEVRDENGNVIEAEQSHIETTKVLEAGSVYSLRYEECLVLECAYLRSSISKMQEQIDQLSATVAQLASQNNN